MAKKITVAELDLNTQAFVKSAQQTKIAIDKITLSQQKLKSQSKTNSQEYIRNEAELKKLKSAYTQQKNAINALQTPYAKLSKELQIARAKAKDLAAQYGINDSRTKAMTNSVQKLDTKLKGIDNSVGQNQRSVGKYSDALKGIGARFLGVTAVIFGFIRVLKDAFGIVTEFEKKNAELNAILQKNSEETKALRDNAEELGATTAKTATEVTNLQIAFARLGFTQEEILNLTEATINGSVAMNSGLSETANLVGAVVKSMDALSSTDAPMIIDTMALATAKSALNFEKLNTALPVVLGAANALNIPFTKVVATLGKLSDSGIEASTSATALRNIYIESAKRGIDYEDALLKISQSTNKLTTANEIFGKRAAVSALIIANNTEKLDELDKALQKAKGTAKEMAEKQLDTLSGKTTLLTSAWQGFILSIENGEGTFAKAIKSMIVGITSLLENLKESERVTNILSNQDLSSGWWSFFGAGFLGRQKNIAKATGQLKALDESFKQTAKGGIEDLTAAYEFWTRQLDKTGNSDANYTKLLEYQLTRIEKLIKAKKQQSEIDDLNTQKQYEQKQSIIDVLLEVDKNLKYQDLEKQSIKELNALLNAKNEQEVKNAEISKQQAKIERDNYLKLTEFRKAQIEQQAINLKTGLDKQLAIIDENYRVKLEKVAANSNAEKLLLEQKRAEKQQAELDANALFEQQKQDLQDQIDLQKAATEEEKALLKAEQDYNKQQTELENLQINEEQKTELLKILTEQREQVIAQIKEDALANYQDNLKKANDAIIKEESKNAKAREQVANVLTGALIGLLGDSLGAKLAAVAIEGGIQAGLVAIQGASSEGKIVSGTQAAITESVAASPLTFGQPWAGFALAQGATSLAASKVATKQAIGKILGASALKALGTLASGALTKKGKYEGGEITDGAIIPHSMRNSGGDDVLIQAKRGEVVLNEQQQAKAGGNAFFSSIGVPGFASGGVISSDVSSNITNQISNTSINGLIDKINDMKIVAIESDITDAQVQQVEIVDGANI
jgi:hypothetical protein